MAYSGPKYKESQNDYLRSQGMSLINETIFNFYSNLDCNVLIHGDKIHVVVKKGNIWVLGVQVEGREYLYNEQFWGSSESGAIQSLLIVSTKNIM